MSTKMSYIHSKPAAIFVFYRYCNIWLVCQKIFSCFLSCYILIASFCSFSIYCIKSRYFNTSEKSPKYDIFQKRMNPLPKGLAKVENEHNFWVFFNEKPLSETFSRTLYVIDILLIQKEVRRRGGGYFWIYVKFKLYF